MRQFRLWVRLNPLQITETIVVDRNAYEAKLMGEHLFGRGNVLNYSEISKGRLKYRMRLYEFSTIKPIKPLSPGQAKIRNLKQTVERGKQQLAIEKDRQRLQRDLQRSKQSSIRTSTASNL